MDTKEETRQNIHQAEIMAKAENRKRRNETTRKMNKLWIWLGVVILVFVLLFWIFGIGTAEDIAGNDNGVNTELNTPSPNGQTAPANQVPASGK